MPTTALMDALVIDKVSFQPDFAYSISGQQDGSVIVAQGRPTLWMADISASILSLAQARAVRAEMAFINGSMGTFYVWNPAAQYPATDPSGVAVGAASPVIAAFSSADPTHITLSGLPASFVISKGDFFSFDYGSPTSRALHLAAETVTCNGSGLSPSFKVFPAVRGSPSVSTSVHFAKAAAEMMLMPGTWNEQVDGLVSSITFRARQVIYD